jgi:hypothetical protein
MDLSLLKATTQWNDNGKQKIERVCELEEMKCLGHQEINRPNCTKSWLVRISANKLLSGSRANRSQLAKSGVGVEKVPPQNGFSSASMPSSVFLCPFD